MILSFNVPADSVPALLGLKGNKLKDTQMKTNTRIKFLQQSEELYNVNIQGNISDCHLAQKLIFLGVRHHQAAVVSRTYVEYQGDGTEVKHDIRAFIAEINNLCL